MNEVLTPDKLRSCLGCGVLEIKKCVVRCANCHRIKTYERAREGESE